MSLRIWMTGICAGLVGLMSFAAPAQTVRYIHTDALGSPVAVTNASRTVIEISEYEPYGQILNRPVKGGPGYTGHVMDVSTGLAYMQQRYYDPGIGRFLSVDPITANATTGGNFNRYRYANNNPYKFNDPDGRLSKNSGDLWGEYSDAGCEMTCVQAGASGKAKPQGKTISDNNVTTLAAVSVTASRPLTGVGAGGATSLGAFMRALLGRGIITAPLVIGGDSRRLDHYVHYGYASDASKFTGGLRPGSYATFPGLGYTGEQAQQMLALPHQLPPDSFYSVQVSSGLPVIGPMPVQPTVVPIRSGGGIEFIFPNGTPPGSVSGPYPLPPEN